jgi:3',5'-cyclic AMP phosphodiesterase CpdA
MQWAGGGLVWSLAGGVPASRLLEAQPAEEPGEFSFVQISDSHIGFSAPANTDVNATLQAAVDQINALDRRPDFVIHTGDLTHLAKPAQFDTMEQILRGLGQKQVFYVPGEHDLVGDNGRLYLERFGRSASGAGWHSFDHRGVHLVGLNNSGQVDGLGKLGREQLDWLKADLEGVQASTPVVVFAHIPLWAVYPQWGWATQDGEEALSFLKRFGCVTVLNGHIHQVMQKVEGKVAFHTAASTAFPQPAPGSAPAAGPMKVAPEKLRSTLGICDVSFVPGRERLATVDSPLT